jgi:hypothetical protein
MRHPKLGDKMTDEKEDSLSIFDLVEGFDEVDSKDLDAFKKAMDKTIPSIVAIVGKRRLSAAKSRHQQLKY